MADPMIEKNIFNSHALGLVDFLDFEKEYSFVKLATSSKHSSGKYCLKNCNGFFTSFRKKKSTFYNNGNVIKMYNSF